MHGGAMNQQEALRGKSLVSRIWIAFSLTSRALAKMMGLLAGMFRATTNGLEWFARWTNAKATGVPLAPVGVDLAGDDWEEPAILPLAPEPPPIPPAAFKHGP